MDGTPRPRAPCWRASSRPHGRRAGRRRRRRHARGDTPRPGASDGTWIYGNEVRGAADEWLGVASGNEDLSRLDRRGCCRLNRHATHRRAMLIEAGRRKAPRRGSPNRDRTIRRNRLRSHQFGYFSYRSSVGTRSGGRPSDQCASEPFEQCSCHHGRVEDRLNRLYLSFGARYGALLDAKRDGWNQPLPVETPLQIGDCRDAGVPPHRITSVSLLEHQREVTSVET